MSDLVQMIPRAGGRTELRVLAKINSARVQRLRRPLEDAFSAVLSASASGAMSDEQVAAMQERYAHAMARRAWLLPVIGWLGAAGLTLAVALAANGGVYWNGYRLEIGLGLLFVVVLALLVPLQRLRAWTPAPWYPLRNQWLWLGKIAAKRTAGRTLAAVQKLTPFDAQYDFAGGTVRCTRITKDDEAAAWQRPLQGRAYFGDGFTLIFKGPPSLDSYLIIHEHCAELEALLARHGVRRFEHPEVGTRK